MSKQTRRPNRELAAKRASSVHRTKVRNRRVVVFIAVFAIMFLIVMGSQTIKKLGNLNELKDEQNKLEKEYQEQLQVAEDLKEKKAYVQTDEYVEEMARKLGLLYPDEVILQPEK